MISPFLEPKAFLFLGDFAHLLEVFKVVSFEAYDDIGLNSDANLLNS